MKKILYTIFVVSLLTACKEKNEPTNLITVEKQMVKADSGWYEDSAMTTKVNGKIIYYDNPMYPKKPEL